MSHASRLLPLVLLALLLGLKPAAAEPRKGFALEARVPASTMAFLGVQDVGRLAERLEATAMGRMVADPEMQAFLRPLLEMVGQLVEEQMREVPPFVTQLLESLARMQGQVGVALVDLDVEQERAQVVLSLDFGDGVGQFVEFLTALRAEIDPEGEHIRAQMRDGRPWWSMEEGPLPVHATVADTTFVLATDAGLLQQVVGGAVEGSLGASAPFQRVREQAGGADLGFFLYGNVPAMRSRFGEMIPPEGRRMMDALGLDTIQAAAYGLAFKGDGFQDTLIVHAPGATHGILPLMRMQPMTRPTTLDFVPRRAFWWTESNLPLSSMLDRVRTMMQRIDPEAVRDMDNGLVDVNAALGVDVETELLAGLEDRFAAYATLPETGGLFPEIALLLKPKDPAAYEAVFERFVRGLVGVMNEEGDVIGSTRVMEYHGHRLHLLELQEARGDDVVPFTPTWTMVKGHLVLTLVPHTMKEIVLRLEEGPAGGLAAEEDFQALMALKPTRAAGMEYLDLKAALALLYDTAVPLLQAAAKPNVMPVPIDWALLPPARRMMPYFRSVAEFITWDDEGIVATAHGPVPLFPLAMMAVAAGSFFSMGRMAPGRMVVVEPEDMVDLDSELDRQLAEVQAEMLGEAVAAFRLEKGRLPGTLSELVDEGLVDSLPVDPWGGSYRLREVEGSRMVAVESAGADRAFGTRDDVVHMRR